MATPPVLRVVEREMPRVHAAVARRGVLDVPQPGALPRRDGPRARRAGRTSTPGKVAGLTYLDFVAPGLLVASAMQIAANESMWPVLGAVKWVKNFHATVATSITAGRARGRLRAVDHVARGARRDRCSCSSPRCSARCRRRGACSRSRPPRCARPRSARRSPRTRSASTATSSFPVIMRVGDPAAVPVLGNVLPDLAAARLAALVRRALAVVARRGAARATRPPGRCTSGRHRARRGARRVRRRRAAVGPAHVHAAVDAHERARARARSACCRR